MAAVICYLLAELPCTWSLLHDGKKYISEFKVDSFNIQSKSKLQLIEGQGKRVSSPQTLNALKSLSITA